MGPSILDDDNVALGLPHVVVLLLLYKNEALLYTAPRPTLDDDERMQWSPHAFPRSNVYRLEDDRTCAVRVGSTIGIDVHKDDLAFVGSFEGLVLGVKYLNVVMLARTWLNEPHGLYAMHTLYGVSCTPHVDTRVITKMVGDFLMTCNHGPAQMPYEERNSYDQEHPPMDPMRRRKLAQRDGKACLLKAAAGQSVLPDGPSGDIRLYPFLDRRQRCLRALDRLTDALYLTAPVELDKLLSEFEDKLNLY